MQQFAAQSASATNRRPHVLIVEDDPDVLWVMQMALEMNGCEVSTASSMAESLDRARAHAGISAVVADYNLRNQETGTDVVQRVRGILGHDVTALRLTGDTSTDAAEAARTTGVDVLLKPVSLEELLGFVDGAAKNLRG